MVREFPRSLACFCDDVCVVQYPEDGAEFCCCGIRWVCGFLVLPAAVLTLVKLAVSQLEWTEALILGVAYVLAAAVIKCWANERLTLDQTCVCLGLIATSTTLTWMGNSNSELDSVADGVMRASEGPQWLGL